MKNLKELHSALMSARSGQEFPEGDWTQDEVSLNRILDVCDEETMRDLLLASKIVTAWKNLAAVMNNGRGEGKTDTTGEGGAR